MIKAQFPKMELIAGTKRASSFPEPKCNICGDELKIHQQTVLLKHFGFESLVYHYDCLVDTLIFILQNRKGI